MRVKVTVEGDDGSRSFVLFAAASSTVGQIASDLQERENNRRKLEGRRPIWKPVLKMKVEDTTCEVYPDEIISNVAEHDDGERKQVPAFVTIFEEQPPLPSLSPTNASQATASPRSAGALKGGRKRGGSKVPRAEPTDLVHASNLPDAGSPNVASPGGGTRRTAAPGWQAQRLPARKIVRPSASKHSPRDRGGFPSRSGAARGRSEPREETPPRIAENSDPSIEVASTTSTIPEADFEGFDHEDGASPSSGESSLGRYSDVLRSSRPRVEEPRPRAPVAPLPETKESSPQITEAHGEADVVILSDGDLGNVSRTSLPVADQPASGGHTEVTREGKRREHEGAVPTRKPKAPRRSSGEKAAKKSKARIKSSIEAPEAKPFGGACDEAEPLTRG